MEPVKIAVAGGRHAFRNNLIKKFQEQEKFQVVISSGNGRHLLNNLYLSDVDAILLDINMPVMNVYETLFHIKIRYPKMKIIILTSKMTSDFLSHFKNYGAQQFISRDCRIDEMINAIMADQVIEIDPEIFKELKRAV